MGKARDLPLQSIFTSLVCKYYIKVEVNGIGKRSSLIQLGNMYVHKKSYSTWPRLKGVTLTNALAYCSTIYISLVVRLILDYFAVRRFL